MSATADHAEDRSNPAIRLGFQPGQVVQELGFDDDVDEDFRAGVETITGSEILDSEYEDDIADVVLLWFREDDGDLVDSLVDAVTMVAGGGHVWLLTPKTGRDGYVEPSEIGEAAPTAGLTRTTGVSAGADWSATKLVAPKAAHNSRR